jgi:hypothetical protein
MLLRWPQQIKSDQLSADLRLSASGQSHHRGPAFARSVSALLQAKIFFLPNKAIGFLPHA